MSRRTDSQIAGRAYNSDGIFQGYVLAISSYCADYFERQWAYCFIQSIGERYEEWVLLDNIILGA